MYEHTFLAVLVSFWGAIFSPQVLILSLSVHIHPNVVDAQVEHLWLWMECVALSEAPVPLLFEGSTEVACEIKFCVGGPVRVRFEKPEICGFVQCSTGQKSF